MPQRPCILAAVDLNGRAQAVVQRAARLAALSRGEVIVAHVVDYHGGFESDHLPFRAPADVRASLVRHARAWLLGLVYHADLPGAEIVVTTGQPLRALAEVAAARAPCYVVAGRSRWGVLGALGGLEVRLEKASAGTTIIRVDGDKPALGRRLATWVGGSVAGNLIK